MSRHIEKYDHLADYCLLVTGKRLEIELKSHESVRDLMEKVQDKEGIPIDRQRMIYSGKQMEQSRSLWDYNICHGSTVHLVLRLRATELKSSEGPSIPSSMPANRPWPSEAQFSSELHNRELEDAQSEVAYEEVGLDSDLAFDDDGYLIDPATHYKQLDILEQLVVESSGVYIASHRYGDASKR